MGRYRSGQTGLTVNQVSQTSGVRIPPGPPAFFWLYKAIYYTSAMQVLQKAKEYSIGALVVLGITLYAYHSITTTVNERGFLGMDKTGRQIFIQTMNHYAGTIDDSVSVTSDWEDYSLIQRLWQEPMRTTLRIKKTMDDDEYLQLQIAEGLAMTFPADDVEESLDYPYKEFLQEYSSEISMTEDYSMPFQELEERADEKGVVTYRDLLRGFGFTDYEYYINGELKSAVELNPNVKNHIEGSFISTVGSIENKR